MRQRLEAKGHAVSSLAEIPARSVEYIYSLNVLEHIEDDVGTVEELAEILKPCGRLFVYVPAFMILWTPMDDLVGHRRRYRRQTLTRILERAGLTVELCRYADSAGFFATLVYKLLLGKKASGAPPRLPLIIFDRLFFPVGRILDKLGLERVVGKNVFAVARHSDLSGRPAKGEVHGAHG